MALPSLRLRRASPVGGLVSLVAACLLSGCPKPAGAPVPRAMTLPSEPAALLALADASFREPPDFEKAFAAASRAFELSPKDAGAAWRASRGAFELADQSEDKEAVLRYARLGTALGEKAVALSPSCGECHYFLAVNLGIIARAATTSGALELVKRVHQHARAAVAKLPDYLEGGPSLVLGLLLVRAPPWPTSIGDLDEGTKLLQGVVERFPESPLARLFLAEAYMLDKKYEPAKSELRRVLGARKEGRWGRIGGRWRREAKKLLRRISVRERDDE